MTINIIPQFLFKVAVTVSLVVTLTACGGGGGSSKTPVATVSSVSSLQLVVSPQTVQQALLQAALFLALHQQILHRMPLILPQLPMLHWVQMSRQQL